MIGERYQIDPVDINDLEPLAAEPTDRTEGEVMAYSKTVVPTVAQIKRLTNALIELDAAVEGIPRPWQPDVKLSITLSHEWIREVGLSDLGRWADKPSPSPSGDSRAER